MPAVRLAIVAVAILSFTPFSANAGKITAAIKKAAKEAAREEKEIAEKTKSKTSYGDILSGNKVKIGGSNNNNTTNNGAAQDAQKADQLLQGVK